MQRFTVAKATGALAAIFFSRNFIEHAIGVRCPGELEPDGSELNGFCDGWKSPLNSA
jgi:hypothetical protein